MTAKSTNNKKNTSNKGKNVKQTAKKNISKREEISIKEKDAKTEGIYKDIVLLLSLAVCVLLLLSNFGVGGIVGEFFSSVLFGIFGWIAYLIPVLIFGVVAFLIANRGNTHAYIKAAAAVVLILLICTFLELAVKHYVPGTNVFSYYAQASKHENAGGFLGGLLASIFCPLIGLAGTYVFLVILSFVCLILITERSLLRLLGAQGRRVFGHIRQGNRGTVQSAGERREESTDHWQEVETEYENFSGNISKKRKKAGYGFSIPTLSGKKVKRKSPEVKELLPEEEEGTFAQAAERKDTEYEEFIVEQAVKEEESVPEKVPARKKASAEKKKEKKGEKTYKIPPLELLTKGRRPAVNSDVLLRETAAKLEQTLQNFGVKARVTNASCGPSVTRYELQPEQGVKVSKIIGLADDIKLNLAVTDLRIEAPIPGKPAVGIEVPNSENTTVMLRDLLESSEFQKSRAKIPFAVGKDIAGKVIVADIAKMPHLLVAGATGSGKSVCINTLIMSILYKLSSEDVRLIMIDPKVVELKVYSDIPHLMIPVVTDPRKAAGALNWAVAEMERRYKLFAEYNVRDLEGFNERIARMEPGENVPKKMPQIVIFVDELADLMMVASKEVEGAICRLAQLARAAGIHLILATQRPSVNVITGLIKANMPSRIALSVSSGVDSRTIIDMNGAEKLLGKGDMLFYPMGYPKPIRVQGSYVSDEEIQKVVDFLIEKNGSIPYDSELEEHIAADPQTGSLFAEAESENANSRDYYFREAGLLIIEKEKASIGMLQRMFKIGFNRAARIMDQLSEAGVVGPEEGTKPRKVLMNKEEFEEFMAKEEHK